MEDRGQETCCRGSARSAERDAAPGVSSSKLRQRARIEEGQLQSSRSSREAVCRCVAASRQQSSERRPSCCQDVLLCVVSALLLRPAGKRRENPDRDTKKQQLL